MRVPSARAACWKVPHPSRLRLLRPLALLAKCLLLLQARRLLPVLKALPRSPRNNFEQSPRSSGSERSEEHTSELQSRQYLVCRLLLEKKNNLEHFVRGIILPQSRFG